MAAGPITTPKQPVSAGETGIRVPRKYTFPKMGTITHNWKCSFQYWKCTFSKMGTMETISFHFSESLPGRQKITGNRLPGQFTLYLKFWKKLNFKLWYATLSSIVKYHGLTRSENTDRANCTETTFHNLNWIIGHFFSRKKIMRIKVR